MGLKESIMEIAESLEKDSNSSEAYVEGRWRTLMKGYAFALRMVCKAVGDSPTPVQTISPEVFHRQQIEKARQEMRKESGKSETVDLPTEIHMEESLTPVAYPVKGGMADATHANLPAGAPDGCHTEIMGEVYTLRGGILCYNPEETTKLHKAR